MQRLSIASGAEDHPLCASLRMTATSMNEYWSSTSLKAFALIVSRTVQTMMVLNRPSRCLADDDGT